MFETIGSSGVGNEGSDIRGCVAGPRYEVSVEVERIEILVAGLCPCDVAPELQTFDWTHCTREFDTLGPDFTRESGCCIGDRHIDVALGDVVDSESPLRSVVPQELLDAALVNSRAGQRQRCGAVDEENIGNCWV